MIYLQSGEQRHITKTDFCHLSTNRIQIFPLCGYLARGDATSLPNQLQYANFMHILCKLSMFAAPTRSVVQNYVCNLSICVLSHPELEGILLTSTFSLLVWKYAGEIGRLAEIN